MDTVARVIEAIASREPTLGANNNLLGFGILAGSNEFQVGNGGFSSGPGNITIQPATTYHLIGAYSMNPGIGPDLTML